MRRRYLGLRAEEYGSWMAGGLKRKGVGRERESGKEGTGGERSWRIGLLEGKKSWKGAAGVGLMGAA